jgi:PIN domain nuclease of toxin-antitoxin system
VRLAFDTSTLVTFLIQERGWQAIHRVINRNDVEALMPGPVLTETVQIARRKGNTSSGAQIHQALTALGLTSVHPIDADLLRAAELLELSAVNPGPPHHRTGQRGTLSLGDALILATTERLGVPIITRDGHWKWMADQALIPTQVVIP